MTVSYKFSGQILETFCLNPDCLSSLCVCVGVCSADNNVFICEAPVQDKGHHKVKLHQSKSLLGCTMATAGLPVWKYHTDDMKLEFPCSVLDYLQWVTYTAVLRKSDRSFLLIPFSFIPIYQIFMTVECSVLCLWTIQRDSAFTARKMQFFKCNWCRENALCALHLIIVEQLNIIDHGGAQMSISILHIDSLCGVRINILNRFCYLIKQQ